MNGIMHRLKRARGLVDMFGLLGMGRAARHVGEKGSEGRRDHAARSIAHRIGAVVALGLACAAITPARATQHTTYFVTNAQGTVVAEMDNQGNTTYEAAYRPYGQQQSGAPQAEPGVYRACE
ncbi:hypothetical protein GCM10027285_00010 [Oleiagrimonas citrea]|uniref:hypothetical protein n=1 Tax=Oleiagrimonas citrea TaxID=1665687 RepID=UPI001964B686|nr:hypothetical protein [Oleiagrimonas citrea]